MAVNFFNHLSSDSHVDFVEAVAHVASNKILEYQKKVMDMRDVPRFKSKAALKQGGLYTGKKKKEIEKLEAKKKREEAKNKKKQDKEAAKLKRQEEKEAAKEKKEKQKEAAKKKREKEKEAAKKKKEEKELQALYDENFKMWKDKKYRAKIHQKNKARSDDIKKKINEKKKSVETWSERIKIR